uniref:Glycosyltransferase n=1 Tax=viral metagenome TaxID=1070528 RepID=A0A6C0EXK3_9ZZZZ
MTVINNIEIDNIEYIPNPIKEAIHNNDPIEDKLHVIIVVSNPCLYARRYILMREFMRRMELDETNVIVYIVEYTYKKQKFIITDSKNPRHLQIRTENAIWHKENMINVGVRKLLPSNWRAFAWIDADIEFESPTWALDTLKILNGSKDIVQLFSHAVDMDKHKKTMTNFTGFGYQYCKGKSYGEAGLEYWHPGYAWACTRKAYEKMGGIYEYGILGSSDFIMALSYIGKGIKGVDPKSTDGYKQTITEFESRVKNLRLGYVPGVIRHHFHGSKKNRKYRERWQILVSHLYDPLEHITLELINNCKVLVPSSKCPKELIDDIYKYFEERNEDEGYLDG